MSTFTGRQNNQRKAVVVGFVALYFAFGAMGGTTVTYDTAQYWNSRQGMLGGLGQDSALTVGNTFIAPAGWSVTLNDFSFYGHGYPADPPVTLHLKPFVSPWSDQLTGRGGGATGSPIYLGPSFVYNAPPSHTNWWPLTANIGGGGVKLVPGQAYVMGFTLMYPGDFQASTGNIDLQDVTVRNPYTPSPIPPGVDFGSGGAVWLIGGALDSAIWDTWGDIGVLAFKADFTVLTNPPGPPQIACPDPLTLECNNGSATGTLTAGVLDTNGLPLEVIWTADGTPVQTNEIPSGGTLTQSNLTFTASFPDGEHTIGISASNGQTPPVTCSTTVNVNDTLPPEVSGISVTPDLLWPPNHRMVPITLTVNATDQCDPSPTARIVQITCNQPSAREWIITGPLTAELPAERSGKADRVYTIYLEITDSSGNKTTGAVTAIVPHSLSMQQYNEFTRSRN